MAEYVEREALLEKSFCSAPATMINPYGGDYVVSVADILSIPAAEVAPVVRCKDCISHEEIKKRNGEVYIHKCSFFDIEIAPNDFCSCGERRSL